MDKTHIIVHCSATRPFQDIGAKDIRRWHVDGNGWSDIGYNIVIRRDGTVENGRDLDGDGDVLEETGAHAYGFNRCSIGICLVGGLDLNGKADANYTFAQYVALKSVIEGIQAKRTSKQPLKVIGHRDVDRKGKTCPNFDVEAFVASC